MNRIGLVLFCLVGLGVMVACGGNASPSPTAATPTPPSAAPAPSPTPGPSPAPTPTPANVSLPDVTNLGMFESLMVRQGSNTVSGQIVIDSAADDGSGTLQLSNAVAGSSYTLQFCPFPSSLPGTPQNRCVVVTSFNADAAGQATAHFVFPNKGTWAGIFAGVRNDTAEFLSAFMVPGSNKQYRSTMKPASALNSNNGSLSPGGDGLRHGSVTVTNSTAHVELQNATVSVTYDVIYCMNGGGSSCFTIGKLSTDFTGTGSTDIDLKTALGNSVDSGIFRLDRPFTIPNGTQVPAVQFVTAFIAGCDQVRCE